MKIKYLNLALFVVAFAIALIYAQWVCPDKPKMIALFAFSLGVWPCAVIHVCKL